MKTTVQIFIYCIVIIAFGVWASKSLPQQKQDKPSSLYRAIITKEGAEDGNIGRLAIQDLINAGYDVATMSHEQKFMAYTSIWIAQKKYKDSIFNRAMIWRDGPSGPEKLKHEDYGMDVVRLVNLYETERKRNGN